MDSATEFNTGDDSPALEASSAMLILVSTLLSEDKKVCPVCHSDIYGNVAGIQDTLNEHMRSAHFASASANDTSDMSQSGEMDVVQYEANNIFIVETPAFDYDYDDMGEKDPLSLEDNDDDGDVFYDEHFVYGVHTPYSPTLSETSEGSTVSLINSDVFYDHPPSPTLSETSEASTLLLEEADITYPSRFIRGD